MVALWSGALAKWSSLAVVFVLLASGELVQDKSSASQPWNLHFQQVKLNLQWRVKGPGDPQSSPHVSRSKTGVFHLFCLPKRLLEPLSSQDWMDLQRSQKGFTHPCESHTS